MKKPISKAQKRALLDDAVANYLSKGGEVEEVMQGISGRENPDQALPPVLFNEKTMQRTDARPALKKVDARKHPNPKKNPSNTRPKAKKKIPVYDDFGEILRWVWSDE